MACAHTANVPSVDITALPGAPAQTDGTLLDECRIVGTGERVTPGKEQPDFDVFASLAARRAAFIIAGPAQTHVTWSHFPARIDEAHGRARVELGGQEHIRFTGYALLRGRTFSAMQRLYAEGLAPSERQEGHLWARAGAPVEMLAVEGGAIVAEVGTPFVSPKELIVRGACSAIVYEPEESKHPVAKARTSDESVLNSGVGLDLFASPEEPRPFTTITTEEAELLVMDVIERRGRFVRVAIDIDDVGFDAWVPSSEVTADVGARGIGLSGFGTSSRCGGMGNVQEGVIRRDTPLFVGPSPALLASAVVEKNADVYLSTSEETTVDDKVVVPFTFTDGMLIPPNDARFWVAKDDVQSR